MRGFAVFHVRKKSLGNLVVLRAEHIIEHDNGGAQRIAHRRGAVNLHEKILVAVVLLTFLAFSLLRLRNSSCERAFVRRVYAGFPRVILAVFAVCFILVAVV